MSDPIPTILKEKNQTLIAIAATSTNKCIGLKNRLPWHLPSDLKHFKQTTTNHHLICGRATYESLGMALPNRTIVVLSSFVKLASAGIKSASTIEDALLACPENETMFVIGGSTVYTQLLPYCSKAIITEIDAIINGDAYFPDFINDWDTPVSTSWTQPDRDQYPTRLLTYKKKV